ncbi:MAG: FAD-linked oxidase C-terminal domain-containing protein [Chthoniobacterales bacterium]
MSSKKQMTGRAMARDLKKIILRAGNVISEGDALKEFASDKWFASHLPDVAVLASSVKEISAVMTYAAKNGIPVTTRGAGYGYVGGCVPMHGGIVLSTACMKKIREVSATDFVAVVEPGVITADLQNAARRKKLFYPPDPASMKNCSIGGNIATNAGGPRCLKYGVTRNYVLGLEVVLADGSIVRVGGRTHKNKTGFDLVSLFTGSEGLLGIVTEATLRLLPHPPARATLSAGFATMSAAAECVQKIFAAGFLPAAVEVADNFTLDAARKHVRDARIPEGKAHLLVELDGQAASVRSEIRAIGELLRKKKATQIEMAHTPETCEQLWALRRKFSESLKATGLIKLNEDVVVPRGRLVDLMNFAEKLQKKSGFPVACFGHAGDGNIHVNIMVPDMSDPKSRRKADDALDSLFAQIVAWDGAITGEHGIGLAKRRWWPLAVSENNRKLHATVKHALDPNGLLNPGKIF